MTQLPERKSTHMLWRWSQKKCNGGQCHPWHSCYSIFMHDKNNKKHRGIALIILFLLIFPVSLLSGCAPEVRSDDSGARGITSIGQLNDSDIHIGVTTDTSEGTLVQKEFPKAQIEYFRGEMNGYLAVSQGKIDAFVFDRLSMDIAIQNGLKDVRLLDETVGAGNTGAVAISPVSQIPDLETKINTFLKEIRTNGTLDDIAERWLVKHEENMPDIPVPETSDLHLVVGTTGSNVPFNYYAGTELVGYDIELAKRFAAWLGATLEFKTYDYDGIVAAAQTGKIDCIFACLFITPERKEAIRFSEPTYVGEIGVMVQDTRSKNAVPEYTKASDLNGKRIGVNTGSIQGPIVERELPESAISYYDTSTDLLTALRQNKIDAFCNPELIVRYMMIDNDDLTYLDEELTESVKIGAIFGKTKRGEELRDEFNEYLKIAKESGVLEEIDRIWLGKDDSQKTITDPASLPAKKGTLRLATDSTNPPATYIRNNSFAGLDIDLAVRFCKARGYGLEIINMSFGGIVDSVSSGRSDFGIGMIAITEERKESVCFSDPLYTSASVLAYLKNSSASESTSFLDKLISSFEKTFIREDRWILFLEGIKTTMIITALSILFGTVLGFIIFMTCRNGHPVADRLARFFVWLVHGMPVVVLLMILYYIVFGNVQISGTVISIIGFTLVFAASVVSMLKVGVGAVERGQLEAAYALGYHNFKAFYRIILPQALPHFMPAYKGEITALIKATAVVGYVAVQDLTKMGDIIRSRTYEAFFPLVVVAILYFVLAGILTFVVRKIEFCIDPKRRTREKILKGVDK